MQYGPRKISFSVTMKTQGSISIGITILDGESMSLRNRTVKLGAILLTSARMNALNAIEGQNRSLSRRRKQSETS